MRCFVGKIIIISYFCHDYYPSKAEFDVTFGIERYYKHKPDIGRIIIKLEVIKDEKQGKENAYGTCPHCGNAIGKFMCYA